MFTPTRIEVRWIGSLTHAVVEPAASGITVLDGHTGSGKTSLLNAVVWALYGYVGGVGSFNRQGSLRSDHAPDTEPSVAAVEFIWAGASYRVVRRLRRSKAGKVTASAELFIDGRKQATMSPDKLTDKIVALTGMTGRAFVSSFFIPQNHLVKLAEGTPAEVQAIIEDQSGVNVLTEQIAAAAKEAADAARTAEAMPGSRDLVASLGSELRVASRAAAAAAATAAAAEQARKQRHSDWCDATATVSALRQRRDVALDAARTASLCRGHISQLESQMETLRAEKAALPPAGEGGDPLRGREQARRQLHLAASLRLRWEASGAAQAAAHHDGRVAAEQLAAVTVPPDPQERVAAAHAQRAAAEHRFAAADAALSAALAAGAGGHDCPVCQQPVEHPAQLVAQLEREMRTAEQSRVAVEQEWVEVQKQQAQFAAATAEATRAGEALNDARRRWRESATTKTQLVADLEALMGSDVDPPAFIATVDRFVADLEAAVDRHTDQINALERHVVLNQQTDVVTEQLSAWQSKLVDATTAAQVVVDETEIADAAALEQQASDAHTAAAHTAATTATDAAVAHAAAAELQRRIDTEQRLVAAKADAIHAAQVAHLAHKVLVGQRRELLGDYTGAVSAAASRVMEQAGVGRHVAVDVDDTFIPRVVLADGRTRPVRECSGGEKLRAALSICLGQAEQHTPPGGAPGMLFADEIATGYDTDTTAAVMEMVTELGRPVLMVGHNPEIVQMAQKVYRFRNSDDRGTRVVNPDGTPQGPPHVTPAGGEEMVDADAMPRAG